MKSFLFLFLSTMGMIGAPAFAVECRYILVNEEYWNDASGTLTIDDVDYDCDSVEHEGVSRAVCGNPVDKKAFYVYFDGAEADFFVTDDPYEITKSVCTGQATILGRDHVSP